MIIRLNGIYGLPNAVAYYRNSGNGCFSFCPSKDLATDLSKEVADAILEHAPYYCKQFEACGMEVVSC